MSSGLETTDLDILVAAILTAPTVHEGMGAAGKVMAFKEMLAALAAQGSTYRMLVEARKSSPAFKE